MTTADYVTDKDSMRNAYIHSLNTPTDAGQNGEQFSKQKSAGIVFYQQSELETNINNIYCDIKVSGGCSDEVGKDQYCLGYGKACLSRDGRKDEEGGGGMERACIGSNLKDEDEGSCHVEEDKGSLVEENEGSHLAEEDDYDEVDGDQQVYYKTDEAGSVGMFLRQNNDSHNKIMFLNRLDTKTNGMLTPPIHSPKNNVTLTSRFPTLSSCLQSSWFQNSTTQIPSLEISKRHHIDNVETVDKNNDINETKDTCVSIKIEPLDLDLIQEKTIEEHASHTWKQTKSSSEHVHTVANSSHTTEIRKRDNTGQTNRSHSSQDQQGWIQENIGMYSHDSSQNNEVTPSHDHETVTPSHGRETVIDSTFSDLIRKLIKKAEKEMQENNLVSHQQAKGQEVMVRVREESNIKEQQTKVTKIEKNAKLRKKSRCNANNNTAKDIQNGKNLQKSILKVPKIKIKIKKEVAEDSSEEPESSQTRRKSRFPRPEDTMPVLPMEHFTNKIGYVKEENMPVVSEGEFEGPLLPLGLYEVKSEVSDIDVTKPCSCNICNKVFRLYSDLEYHLRCHFGERKFKCELCEKSFKIKQQLKKHELVHSNEKPFVCDIEMCGKSFKDNGALQKHKRTHNPEKSFFCDICDKGFVSRLNLKNHKVTHLPDRPFKCQYCDKGFNKNANLKHHLKVHFGFKPFPCSYCAKTFPDKARWKMHERIHWKDKPFKCTICPAQFAQISNLKVHIQKHSGEKPFKCEICGKSYLLKSYLNIHTKRHLGAREFKCAMCGKEFYQKGEFNRHMRTHTGEKTHFCDPCNEGFIDKAAYNAHQRAKHGGQMYTCQYCNKEFLHDSNLNRHVASVHTKLKKHFCEKCGQGFLFHTDLRSHMNRHDGFKPFVCDICGKRFYKTSLLNMHKKVHTGEVFFCEVCKRTFNYSSSYYKHLSTVTHKRRQEDAEKGEGHKVKGQISSSSKGERKSKRKKIEMNMEEEEVHSDGQWSELDKVLDDSENTEEEDADEDEGQSEEGQGQEKTDGTYSHFCEDSSEDRDMIDEDVVS